MSSFVVIAAAYSIYSVLVVPWMVPTVRRAVSPTPSATVESPTDKYRPLIEPLFAADRWERQASVHIIRVQGFLILLQKIEQEGQQLKLEPCTLVHLGEAPGERTWVVQAERGATIQFSQEFNWHSGEMGEIESGFFPGNVNIRGRVLGPRQEEPEDIEIATRGVQFNRQVLSTTEEVQFRFGKSHGKGRDLSVRFALDRAQGRSATSRVAPTLVREIELVHLDRVEIHPSSGWKFPALAEAPPSAAGADPTEKGWVVVTAKGPLFVDFQGRFAQISRQVQVARHGPSGNRESLSCEALRGEFASLPAPLTAHGGPAPAFPRMQFSALKVTGAPATLAVRDPENKRWYQFASTRIEYLADEGAGPGQFVAQGGGEFHSGVAGGPAAFSISWKKKLELLPHDDLLELTIDGQASCMAPEVGALHAELIWLQLIRSRDSDGSTIDIAQGRYRPHVLTAKSDIVLQTEQLEARTDHLDVVFTAAAASPVDSETARLAGPVLQSPQQASVSQTGSGFLRVRSDSVHVDIARNPRLFPKEIVLEGATACQWAQAPEAPTMATFDGDRIRLWNLTRDGGAATLVGRPARVRGRGMALSGGNVEVRMAENRIWIDGPGAAEAPLPDHLSSPSLPGPAMVDVTWEEGMQFDGQELLCQGKVLFQGPSQRMRCGSIVSLLDQPVRIWDGASIERASLQQVMAKGKVAVENQSSDDRGWTAVDRASVEALVLDYQRRRLQGTGPGWIETVRRGSAWPSATPAPGQQSTSAQGLNYLRVDFSDRFEGGLAQREVTFHGSVRSIVGPVQNWNQRLHLRPDGQLYPHTMVLGCRTLQVYQSPLPSAGTSLELVAIENTQVQGRAADGKLFGAQGHRLSYDQGKDQIVLEGEARQNAQLWYETFTGGDRKTVTSQRIGFRPSQSEVTMDGIGILDFRLP